TLTECGVTVATSGTLLATTNRSNTTSYRFEVIRLSDNNITTIDRPNHWFNFNMVDGYTPGVQYGVRVAIMTSGVYSLFGDVCVITSPGAARIEDAKPTVDPFTVVAYPNPFADAFGIHMSTTAEQSVGVKVFDMTGRLIETREVQPSALETLKVG